MSGGSELQATESRAGPGNEARYWVGPRTACWIAGGAEVGGAEVGGAEVGGAERSSTRPCMWNVLRAMSPGDFSSCMCTHMVQVRVMPPHTVNCR